MSEISSNAARAGDALLHLGECGPEGATLKDIAAALGESRQSLHRTLAALAQRGFVETTGQRGRYRLGPAIHGLARRPNHVEARLTAMRPVLYEIVARTGFSTFLMQEAGLDALCLELISPIQVRSLTGGVGGRVPLGIAAGSLAILAAMPPESRTAVIAANADRYAAYPSLRPMSGDRVRQMTDEAIAAGYSCDFSCFFPGEGGIGLAVPARSGGASGMSIAISIHGEIAGREALEDLAATARAILSEADPWL